MLNTPFKSSSFLEHSDGQFIKEHDHLHTDVNVKYPLSDVLYSGDTKIYKIAIISDLDQDSKAGDNKWKSILRSVDNIILCT